MAHYQLYFPDATAPDDAVLIDAGLSGLLNTGAPPFWLSIMRGGPDGGRGMLCTWLSDDGTDPSRHVDLSWTPAIEDRSRGLTAGRFWYGVIPDRAPIPSDLQLSRRFFGYEILLADGNHWHIPSAIRLPHQHGLNADGEWERRVAKQYQQFYDRSMQYGIVIFEHVDAVEALKAMRPELTDEDRVANITLDDAATHCCEALMLNYRVTPEIIDFMGLLDDNAMVAIITASLDLPQIHEVLNHKKKRFRADIPVG